MWLIELNLTWNGTDFGYRKVVGVVVGSLETEPRLSCFGLGSWMVTVPLPLAIAEVTSPRNSGRCKHLDLWCKSLFISFSMSFWALNLIENWICRSGSIGELMGCVLLLWNTCALMCRHPRGKLKLMFCWRAAQMARWGITCAYVCVFCLSLCLLAFCNVI